jgi:hypothetical protein
MRADRLLWVNRVGSRPLQARPNKVNDQTFSTLTCSSGGCKEWILGGRSQGSARRIAISDAALDRSLRKGQVQGQAQTARCYDALLMQQLGLVAQ